MRTVTVSPYDPLWAIKYAEEAEKIKAILGDELITIHHIGSTSVPGLSAKPIIDILVEVRQIEAIDSCNPAFIYLGYEPRGEFGIPSRRFLEKAAMNIVRIMSTFFRPATQISLNIWHFAPFFGVILKMPLPMGI